MPGPRFTPETGPSADRVSRLASATVGGYADAVALLLLGGLLTHHVASNPVVAAVHLARRATQASLPRLAVLPVLFVAVIVATALTGSARRDHPSRSAVLLLGLQAVVVSTFLLFGVAVAPRATDRALLATAVLGAAGVAAVACQSALFRLASERLMTRWAPGPRGGLPA